MCANPYALCNPSHTRAALRITITRTGAILALWMSTVKGRVPHRGNVAPCAIRQG